MLAILDLYLYLGIYSFYNSRFPHGFTSLDKLRKNIQIEKVPLAKVGGIPNFNPQSRALKAHVYATSRVPTSSTRSPIKGRGGRDEKRNGDFLRHEVAPCRKYSNSLVDRFIILSKNLNGLPS